MKRKERVSFLRMSVSEIQTTPLGIKSIELYCAVVFNTAVSSLCETTSFQFSYWWNHDTMTVTNQKVVVVVGVDVL